LARPLMLSLSTYRSVGTIVEPRCGSRGSACFRHWAGAFAEFR
jgi:hypothetical protein